MSCNWLHFDEDKHRAPSHPRVRPLFLMNSSNQSREWHSGWIEESRLPHRDSPLHSGPDFRPKRHAPVRGTIRDEKEFFRGIRPRIYGTTSSGGTCPASTIGRWLGAERLRPWRYHAWQHIHDPISFLRRARPVLQAYAQAQALLQEGNWLVSVDEKTSLQAREGEQPPRPACPGKPLLHEACYQPRGARHLFAGLSIADGQVYGTCRQRKCFVDFQAFVQQQVIPEALRRKVQTVTFILDNGTTQAPKQLESWLQEQQQACEGQLHFQLLWLPTNASWLDQIEIWFSLLQRKCLQPNHFVTTTALETALTDYITHYNQTAKPINWTYSVQKLGQKLGAHL